MGFTQFARSLGVGEFDVSVRRDLEDTIVTVSGEADLFTRPVLVEALVAAVAEPDGPVVVDLSQTVFIDAGSMRVLTQAAREVQDRGRAFVFRSPSRVAARVIEFFGLTSLCEGYPTSA